MKLNNYIDYKNDATSKLFADASRINNSSPEMNSPLSNENHVIATVNHGYIEEIEYSAIAEEIIIEDESDFYSLSPNSNSSESKIYKNDRSNDVTNDDNHSVSDKNASSKFIIVNNSTSSGEIAPIDAAGDHTYEASKKAGECIEQAVTGAKISTNEGTDKPYKCHICDKTFSRNSSLKCHIRLHVEGPDNMLRNTSSAPTAVVCARTDETELSEDTYSCVTCDKTFTNKKALQYHIESHNASKADDDESGSECSHEPNEGESRDYKCIMCNKRFSRRSSLTFHYKFHPVEKSPSAKKPSDNESPEMNDSEDRNKHYQCSHCDRKFTRKNSLQWHIRIHDNQTRTESNDNERRQDVKVDKPVDTVAGTYKCRKCDQSFSRVRNLKLHMAVHTDTQEQPETTSDVFERLYEQVSSRNYACSEDTHSHTQEAVTLFKCNLCNKCFCQLTSLKEHFSWYHKDYVDQMDSRKRAAEAPKVKVVSNTREIGDKTSSNSSCRQKRPKDCDFVPIPGLYKCGVCDKAFDHVESLKDHVTVHLRRRTFRCGVCDQLLPTKNQLKEHLIGHERKSSSVAESNSSKESFLCVVCDRSFASGNALEKHMNCHRKMEEEIIPRVSSSGRRIKDPRNRENDFAYNSDKVYKSSPSTRHKLIEDEPAQEKDVEVSCASCRKAFRNPISLKFHLLRSQRCTRNQRPPSPAPRIEDKPAADAKDRDLDSLKCSCCDRLFTSIVALTKHVSNHSKGVPDEHVEDEEESTAAGNFIKCDRCDKFFTSIRSLKLHISEHTRNPNPKSEEAPDEQAKSFKCDVCGEKFDDEESLDEHMNSHETPDNDQPGNEVQCDRCNKVFPALRSLNIHKGRFCRGELEKYDKQEETNEQNEQMEVDEDSDLDATDTLECCDEVFDSERAYNIHRTRYCTKETESLVCCNRTFATARNLRIHKFYHKICENQPQLSLTCKCCNFTFCSVKSLKVHLARKAKQADEHENVLSQCDRCDKYFLNAASLSNHMAEHSELEDSDEDVFVLLHCDVCDKSFKNSTALKKHKATHVQPEDDDSSDETFKCSKCDKVFETERSLRVHRAYHTKIERVDSFQADNLYEEVEGGKYKCTICGRVLDSTKAVEAHITVHKVNSGLAYQCNTCGRAFNSGGALRRHMPSHRLKSGDEDGTEYPCLKCDKIFTSLEQVAEHKVVHENESSDEEDASETYPCLKCPRTFATRKGLGAHRRVHEDDSEPETQSDTDVYPCPKCDRIFSTRKGLGAHRRVHEGVDSEDEPNELEYPCAHCNRSFPTPKGLARHKSSHKNELEDGQDADIDAEGPYQCAHCDRAFPTRKGLNKHKSIHRDDDEEAESMDVDYQCSHCDRSFPTAKGLAKHKSCHKEVDESDHEEADEYECELCNRRFHSVRGLSIHKSSHKDVSSDDEDTYSCRICDSKFHNEKALNTHMRKHLREITSSDDQAGADDVDEAKTCELSCTMENTTEDGRRSAHRCDLCQLSFADLKSLSKHSTTIHQNDDKNVDDVADDDVKELRILIHQCKMCDEAFTDHVSLQDHSIVHTCDKKTELEKTADGFQCQYCPRVFPTIHGIRKHSTIHKNDKRRAQRLQNAHKVRSSRIAESNTRQQVDSTVDTEQSISSIPESCVDKDTTEATSANTTVVEPIQISLNLSELERPIKDDANSEALSNEVISLKCDEQFDSSDDLNNHRSTRELERVRETPSLGCNICGRQFNAPKALKKHLMFHKFNDFAEDTEITSEPYECNLCPKTFKNENDLKRHSTFHGAVANGSVSKSIGPILKCNLCDETFTRVECLKNHSVEVHDRTIHDEITFKCELCDEQFAKASAFMLHKKYHRNETCADEEAMPFECISCEKCFRFKDHLLEHVKTHTDNELVLDDLESLVEQRSDEFVDKPAPDLERRVEEHIDDDSKLVVKSTTINTSPLDEVETEHPSGVENHLDDHIHDIPSVAENHLDGHIDDIEPAKVNVKMENEVKENDIDRADDLESLTNENTVSSGTYDCTFCAKKFLKSCHLGTHVRIHKRKSITQPTSPVRSSSKQLECMVCGMKFRIQSTLALHYQSHSQGNQKKALKRATTSCDGSDDEAVRSKRKSVSRY